MSITNTNYVSNKQKALRINLDTKIYGSFAEIGAGQEVASNFFKAGGASGTIAKTMSAYDMAFSDAIYGETKRYVSEDRLLQMLDKEFSLLPIRLPEKAPTTRFFAFADTVEALNFRRTNQGHGWLGVQFQLRPDTPPNHCVIHVLLHDSDQMLQQQVLGIVGVNLIYGCFFYHHNPETFLDSLVDDLMPGRIEIDYFELKGPDFPNFDNRVISLKLVKKGLANATMFAANGDILQPTDELYKKNVLILRGRFRPVTLVNMDMIEKSYEQFCKEPDVDKNKIVVISEITLSSLKANADDIDEKDFMDRVEILCSLGQNVMISNYQEYYMLAKYMSKLTKNMKMAMVLGIHSLTQIFDEKYYKHLQGGILESFGMLFCGNLKLYVYPSKHNSGKGFYNCDNFELPFHLSGLFRYLFDNDKIQDVEDAEMSHLDIFSDNVLLMIKNGQAGWENMVPYKVAEFIKKNGLFGYTD
ncbi:MAG: TonB-dependent receptor [Bacteroidetes bacterium]|nr:MAG: TonB-dependent receptor [Bacteroidota bacterium]